MFGKFETMVAFRYLRSRRKEGFISVIAGFSFTGIMLGVATLIVVMSVMNGFRSELMKRVLGINAHISVAGNQLFVDNYEDVVRRISDIPGVKKVAPVVKGEVLATSNGQHTGVMVRGMNLHDFKRKKIVAENMIFGRMWDDASEIDRKNAVVIGSRISRSMGLLPGDIIRLISPKTTDTFIGSMPRIKDYTVVGVFEVGMYEYDSTTIFMPMEAAQTYFKLPEKTNSIEVYVEDPDKVSAMAESINKVLGEGFYVVDWMQANSSFINSMKVERNVMFLILTLIIIIAAFNIISGMVMLVTDKGKEIAILRTIGASKGSVMRIFFICGSSIGVVGTFFGFLLGLGFAKNIETIRTWLEGLTGTELFAAEVYFLSKLPAEVHNSDVVNVVIMSLVLSFLATLYPAWRASRISPAEGLRYE